MKFKPWDHLSSTYKAALRFCQAGLSSIYTLTRPFNIPHHVRVDKQATADNHLQDEGVNGSVTYNNSNYKGVNNFATA